MAVLGLDNPVGLFLLYTVYGLSFNVFVYTAFIHSIPRELEEAATMDGASTWGIFRRIIFPLLTPMNATVGILTCLWAWNDFLLPLVILSDPATRTSPRAVCVPEPVQHQLHGRLCVLPDGHGTTAPGLPLRAALGDLRCHAWLHQVTSNRHPPTPVLIPRIQAPLDRQGRRTGTIHSKEGELPRMVIHHHRQEVQISSRSQLEDDLNAAERICGQRPSLTEHMASWQPGAVRIFTSWNSATRCHTD